MADRLKITPTESVLVRQSGADLLEVEATYEPAHRAPPKHLHPHQDERFRVLQGTLRVRTGGEERDIRPGETIEIPRGTVHQMWNAADEPAIVTWQTRPALRTEEWFRSIDALYREGRVGRNGEPGPLAYATLLTEYRDVFRLAVGPDPVVRRVLRLLAIPGRARGYGPAG